MSADEIVTAISVVLVAWWAVDRTRRVPEDVPAQPPAATPASGPKAGTYPGPPLPADDGAWVQIPTGPVWSVRDPARAWVTPTTLDALVAAMLRYAEHDAARLRVLDASRRSGGYFPPHRSHREGRDVDLRWEPPMDMPTRPLAQLLRQLVEDPRLEAVFLSHARQKLVWDLIKADPGLDPGGKLAAELQYPLPPHAGFTRIRHWSGHHHHLHVRYRA